ncbi:MAG: DsbA family protein [Candidatus Micrarchaeaceae archaeon]
MVNKESRSGKGKAAGGKEPVFIVKPAFRNYGLDYLHIMLIALVIILVVLAFALSTLKRGVVVTNCQNGANASGICNTTVHNSTQALAAAERDMASYSEVNTSLSLIPYYSLINQSVVEYLPSSREWMIVIPYIDPLLNSTVFDFSLLLYDSNLSVANSFLQTLKPAVPTNNSVVALGTVNLYGEAACKSSTPIPVYVITDPYAPGALAALNTSEHIAKIYGNKINVTYYFIFSGYSVNYYDSFGIEQTQQLGMYMECASMQRGRFGDFISNLSIAYTGKPIENQTLYQIAEGSGLNLTQLGACMDNVTSTLNIQAQFAKLYNIVSTPTVIVNCRYSTIPQTMGYAINYSLMNLNS